MDPLDPGTSDSDCPQPEHAADEPNFRVLRVTIVNGRITMTPWHPGLAEGGPLGNFFRLRERDAVAIADLRILYMEDGERELVVEFMAAGPARLAAERALRSWASQIGYRRVWFPGGPVDLSRDGPPPGTAAVVCPTCQAEWIDSSPGFWLGNHRLGHFPLDCPLCGNGLPQWTVSRGDSTRCRGSARSHVRPTSQRAPSNR